MSKYIQCMIHILGNEHLTSAISFLFWLQILFIVKINNLKPEKSLGKIEGNWKKKSDLCFVCEPKRISVLEKRLIVKWSVPKDIHMPLIRYVHNYFRDRTSPNGGFVETIFIFILCALHILIPNTAEYTCLEYIRY